MIEDHQGSDYFLEIKDIVQVVEFSPFEWSSNLLAVGTTSRVIVGSCRFQEEDKEVDGLQFEQLRDFHHGPRVTAIAWSPQTALAIIPRILRLVTAGGDRILRLFKSDLKNEDAVQLLEGHTDYVNDVVFEPEKGDQLASVSDDHTCRVWDLSGVQKASFPLGSAGMSIKWHPMDSLKIMVGEKNGTIRFYNLLSQQPLLSLDCTSKPLRSADWCLGDALKVAVMGAGDLLIFDTSRSSLPVEKKPIFSEGGKQALWCKSNPNIVATVGAPQGQIKVLNTKFNQVLLNVTCPVSYGLSWHFRMPILVAGVDRQLKFWVIHST
ncbi:nucleoporin Nup37 [Lingula anatina]|uniref:Nucleoporin Nup37 n=1 Tax=Lingula anatina TaxID=7574 RepID=A0A1S3H5P8_LINAN|nr:nucleoporin Nup37 [Lingula anatina]|eukprot:XP_013381292.1 nucleoporin Nup37 [Lingula anatina]